MRMKTAFLLLLALCLLIQAAASAEEETLTADMIPGRWTVDRVAWEDTVQPGLQTGITLLFTFPMTGPLSWMRQRERRPVHGRSGTAS